MSKTRPQGKSQLTKRSQARLTARMDKKIIAYAAAAGAGLLIGQPAEGKIVYTPANIQVHSPNYKFGLDVNHDGIRDFFFYLFEAPRGSEGLRISTTKLFPHNGIMGTDGFASALSSGVTVGPGQVFQSNRSLDMANDLCESFCSTSGNWANAQDKYLGLRFVIQGKVHYGWVRMNVNAKSLFTTTFITGIAFETTPNQAIITGQTQEADVLEPRTFQPAKLSNPSHHAATLGVLAQGARGMDLWRREEEPVQA
jgi:hypothetical protein